MKDLSNFTLDQLKEEIVRRENVSSTRPKIKKYIDWNSIVEYTEELLNVVEKEGYAPKDTEYYLFETIMVEIYGEDFWKWWNKNVYG